ncbi:hypothetical protein ACB098_01G370400 [Castanea mollissima]
MENSASREIQLEITASASIRTSTECRIYKVPYHLRKWSEEAYTPQVISIGPIHHGNNKFQTMEKHKMENSIRQCYVETVVDLGSDDFVKMIMLDVSFILELFLKFNSESWPREDPLLVEAWLLDTVFRDLLLLENQLPFFVIEMLFNLAFPYGSNNRSLIQLTFDFFKTLNIYDRTPICIAKEEIKHFTDLLRTFQLPESSKLPYRGPDTTFPKYSATQLHEAGVNRTGLDFKNGELEIPTLTFEDDMEDLVRNVMALQQCNIRLDTYFTDFYIILDHLVDTTKDVELLIKNGIIVNCLGDSETVTSMINKLNRGIIRRGMNANYINLCEKLNAFAEGFWNRNKVTLISQYFNSPWKGTATIAALLFWHSLY